MDCKEAKNLIGAKICGDIDCDSELSRELEAHLSTCKACAVQYQRAKQAVVFIKQHEAIFAEVLKSPEEKKVTEQEVIEHSWKSVEAKLDQLETLEREKKQAGFRQFIFRASSIAACLIIGVSILFVLLIHSKSQVGEDSGMERFVSATKPSVKVEQLLKNNRLLLPASRQIVSVGELKTLIVNDKHRIVMNTYSLLAIEPFVTNSNVGCLVNLASGQIYVHVQHDGNPFLVATAHGKAVITGTAFDVKVTDDSTTLVVSEGTVQFQSGKGIVEVAGGRKSRIVGRSAPTSPALCNAARLTAWATGHEVEPALAQAESNWDAFDLPLPTDVEPIVLEKIDYDRWVKEKRDWFKQQFPHIFQLQNALAKEGIEVDYPELLVQTGDVWQFAFLETVPVQFSLINQDSLLNAAHHYGFDKQWLLENVPSVKSALEKPILSENNFASLKTFERWLEYFDETNELKPPTPIYSFHASTYLAETRSLIWFAVRDGKYDLTGKERTSVLALLQKEITVARKCQSDVFYPQEKPKPSRDEDKCRNQTDNIIEHIRTMRAIEEGFLEYGIGGDAIKSNVSNRPTVN